DQQEDGTNQNVETMEARRHEEGRAIDRAGEFERSMLVLVELNIAEQCAEQHGNRQTPYKALAIVMEQSVVRPGQRRAGEQQDDRVVKRQVERVDDLEA